MKKILFLAFLVILINSAYAQITNCTQVLRLAQSTYEQGRLHELPTLMDDCLKKTEAQGGFTKQQRVDAYRYLTLAYIYLEEPEKADESMLNLLRTDHYFEPNPNVDPAEFLGLYHTFRTTPVFSFGIKGGVNGNFPLLSKNYYVSNASEGKGKYGAKVAYQAGLVFEKNFFEQSKNKTLKKLTFAPELIYTIRSMSYNNSSAFVTDSLGTSAAAITVALKQTWLDLNLIFQYKLKDKGFNPYIGFGPGFGYLLNASNVLTFTRASSVGTVSGPAVPAKSTYTKLVTSLMAVAGIKYQFGSVRVLVEARLQYGLTNIANQKSRSNPQQVFDYNYLPGDLKQFSGMLNIGVVFPYFNPVKKKLHKK